MSTQRWRFSVHNPGVQNSDAQMSSGPTNAVARAQEIAESILFPAALETDRSDLLPVSNLDALADAGLYGLFGPSAVGGLESDLQSAGAVVEALASGCLTTALVWLQHHGIVGSLLFGPDELRDQWMADLCDGTRRSGIVFAGLLPGPSSLIARPIESGWTIDGDAPWVSGWGRIDTLQIAARGPDDTVVTVAIDDLDDPSISATRHRLAALDASGTVRLRFDSLDVPEGRVLSVVPHEPEASGGLSLRLNGSLALGVVRRCCELIGPSPLDDDLARARIQLDEAGADEMAAARANASALAVRATAQLLVRTGSRSIEIDNHAQRLAREAMFLLVFGSRPAIKESLIDLL